MLNSDFLNEQAGVLADRLRREAGDDAAAQVRAGPPPGHVPRARREAEVDRGVDLIGSLAKQRRRRRRTRR